MRLFIRDALATAFAEIRMGIEPAGKFCLGLDTTGGEGFQPFGNHGGFWLDPNKNLTASGDALIAHGAGRDERPKAVQQSALHAVEGLQGIILPLVLRRRHEDIFNENVGRIIAKLHAGAVKLAASSFEQIAQIPIAAHVSRKAVHVVDDHHSPFGAVPSKMGKQGVHALAVFRAAGDVVGKDLFDLVAHAISIFAACGLLRGQAIAFTHLRNAGNAAIYNRFTAY